MRLRYILLISAWLLAAVASAQGHNDTIKVMTFNLHAGHDASLEQIGLLIKQHQPDFVALQEVDLYTHRTNCPHQNNRDFITELAYFSGMQGLFGPTIKFSGGHYGIGLLTRHQFVEVSNIKLPHPVARMEQRGLLQGTFILPDGDTIMFASTHLEAFDSISREAQAQFLLNHLADSTHPVILAGDFNASPDDQVIGLLTNQWLDCTAGDFTFSVNNPSEKIDYILARPIQAWRTIDSQVIPVKMSDHFPVIATLVISHE
ncbi:MAG: endonuclease/exonuclease/phosphatase family protein [Muribaculaceae bacterium]|nr:endonuclease/exonuclease/phosphatase family protein [Muribaculaceae bacterium]